MTTKMQRETNQRYKRGVRGVLTGMYNNHVERSRKYGYRIGYEKEELYEIYARDPLFLRLYKKWVESGYDKWRKPSLDRINPYKGYTIDNMRLMTWRENWEKGRKEWAKKNQKRVRVENTFTGSVVYCESMKEAAEYIGCSVSAVSVVASKRRKEVMGFKVAKK